MIANRKTVVIALLLVLILSSGGCVGSGPGNNTQPTTTVPTITTLPTSIATSTPAQTSGPPEVFIVSPEFDAGIPVGNVTVIVEVHNFRLVAPNGRGNIAGEGHLIYYRDVVPAVEPGKPAYTTSGTYAATVNTSYTWYHIIQGTHTFSVQLVNNDDTPLRPPVVTGNDVTAYGGNLSGAGYGSS